MKVNSINQQTQNFKKQQNFKGKGLSDALVDVVMKHPIAAATTLASSSAIAQKVVMSGSEALIGPFVDIATGRAITKITKEKDGRTNQSSKVQAIRTFAQAVGGTIVGVAVRAVCIGGAGIALGKIAQKGTGQIAKIVNPNNIDKTKDLFKYQENLDKWSKSVGGFVAILAMLVTNFVIDPPLINFINKKATNALDMVAQKNKKQAKEVKNG